MSRTSTEKEKFGIDFSDWLTDPNGSPTTISGTPTVAGVNGTGTYVSNASGIVYATFLVASGLGPGAKGELQMTVDFANGEKVSRKIDLNLV